MRWLILLALLVACTEIPLEGELKTPEQEDTTLRPDIPRTDIPEERDTLPPPEQEDSFLREPIDLPGEHLAVPLGEEIGDHYHFLTSRELPILKSRPVQPLPGLPLRYSEVFIFHNSTGRVIFTKDEKHDAIDTFLHFAGGRPIYTYELHLTEGTFYDLRGRDIVILGDTYTMTDFNRETVHFRNPVASLLFKDGGHLVVDDVKQPHTEVHVDDHLLSYTVFAHGTRDTGDDMLLSPGESLRQNTDAFLPFDITYQGLAETDIGTLTLQRTKHGYRLIVQNVDRLFDIPLVEERDGTIVLGTKEHEMHITPCERNEFCIKPDDSMLLTAPDGRNFVLWYSDVSEDPNRLILRSKDDRYSYEFLGKPGDARTNIIVEDVAFPAFIGPQQNDTGEYNISVAQGFFKDRTEIVLAGGFILRMHNIVENTLPLELLIPPKRTHLKNKQSVFINITFDKDWQIVVPNLQTVADDDTLDQFGMTRYGIFAQLEDNKRNLPAGTADELTLFIPEINAHGIVVIA